MPNDFLSAFTFLHLPENIQRQGIDYLLGSSSRPPAGLEHLAQISDPLARLNLLAQALLTPNNKDHARAGSRREPGGLPQLYRSQAFHAALEQRRQELAALGLLPTLPDLTSLPAGSFGLHFTFTLRTPYISRDEVDLHILDNPVRKDKVFGLPMVAPTGWKGALRAALRQLHDWHDDHPDLLRLFGDVGSDEGGWAGRLHFYPTFFTRLGLEVINPHNRQSNAGKQPIYFESVPAGATGDFALLYVPGDRIGEDEAETRDQVAADIQLVVASVTALMTAYGFGAKTSNGFGTAEETFVKDGPGKSQAHIEFKNIGRYRCHSFAGLCQAADKLVETLTATAGDER